MYKKFLGKIKYFYGHVIKHDTTLVIIIALLILLVGLLLSNENRTYKNNILESGTISLNHTLGGSNENTILINNKQYIITFKEIK